MQNKLLKIARMGFVLAILSFGALPALALNCSDWSNAGATYWKNMTVKKAQACLDKGIDINEQGNNGFAPFHRAVAYNENPKVVRMLLDSGADVNAPSSDGRTPLHWVARWNTNPAIIKIFIEFGADVNAQDKNGWSPLHWMARWNVLNPEMVILLIESGADVKLENKAGQTPFGLGLTENGASLNVPGATPAYWALKHGRY